MRSLLFKNKTMRFLNAKRSEPKLKILKNIKKPHLSHWETGS